MKTSHQLIQRIALTGLSHHQYPFHAEQLVPGVELMLNPQPNNPYDRYAIAVHMQDPEDGTFGDQIGWIPKGENEMLFRILQGEAEVRCKVISHDPKAPLGSRLYVGNYLTIQE